MAEVMQVVRTIILEQGEFEDFEDGSNIQRMMYFDSLDDVDAKADSLRQVIGAYVLQHS